MTENAVLQLLHHKEILVTSIPASVEGQVAFVGVYPIDPAWPSTIATLRRLGVSMLATSDPLYQVSAFEVDRELVESQDYLSEEDLSRVCDVLAIGDEDLRAKLKELGVGLDQLDFPSKSDYPL